MSAEQLTHKSSKSRIHNYPVSILLNNFDIKQNIGSVFRLADALGCEQLYLTGRTARPPSRKITKTARSADKYVAFSYCEDALNLVHDLKEQGYQIISLELTQNSIQLDDLQLNSEQKVCVILGSENEGVDDALLEASDTIVHIPMHGHISSMNVATAAAIALYKIIGLISLKN